MFMSQVPQLLLDGSVSPPTKWPKSSDFLLMILIKSLIVSVRKKVLLGWRSVLNPEHADQGLVRAVIEVKISPEREGGFDRQSPAYKPLRGSRFMPSNVCGYDLLVVVKGSTLHQVASFVSERLATIGGVLSTATHFMLRSYKEQGYLLVDGDPVDVRPAVSP